jgi:hypothetical protein
MSLHTLFKHLNRKGHRTRKNTRRRPELDTLEAKTLLSGLVQGYVTGPGPVALPGAEVRLLASDPSNPNNTYDKTCETNPDGYYSFDDVPAGHYILSEVANGYVTTGATVREMFNRNATVSATQTIQLDVVDLTATPYQVTFHVGSEPIAYGIDYNGTPNGQVAPSDDHALSGSYYAGRYVLDFKDANGVLITTVSSTCSDLCHDVYAGQPYDVRVGLDPLTDNAAVLGSVGEIGYLSNHYNNADLSREQAAGLQVAIWALMKDGPGALEASITSINGDDGRYLGPGVADEKLPFHTTSGLDAVAQFANNLIMEASGKSEHAYFLNSVVDGQGQLVGGQGQLVGGQGQLAFGDEYDFQDTPMLVRGSTATIGYWANKNGQALLKSYKTGDIGDFLAETCPNLFGNLKGANGTQVAAYFLKVKAAAKGDMNAYAQTLCTALGVWLTGDGFNDAARAQHFVQQKGIGTGGCLYNVGNNGAAFDVPNGTAMTILDMLKGYDSLCVTTFIGTPTSLPISFKHTKGGLGAGGSMFDTINNTGDIA